MNESYFNAKNKSNKGSSMLNNNEEIEKEKKEYNGDWGLGIGDWGLGMGIGDWAQSPIPNPQSPIPNPQ